MQDKSKIRTPAQKLRKMLKEEKIIIDLELAVKKEEFRKVPKRTIRLNFLEKNKDE